MMRVAALVALIVAIAAACSSHGSREPVSRYLSLGDSVAAGNGASDKTTTSFVSLVAQDEGNLETLNAAFDGATTARVIDEQLPRALALIADAKLATITIAIGINDLATVIPNPICRQNPLPTACPLDDALAKVEMNVRTILERLRTAHPHADRLARLSQLLLATGHPWEAAAAQALPRLNDLIRRVAANYPQTAIAEPALALKGAAATSRTYWTPSSTRIPTTPATALSPMPSPPPSGASTRE